MAKLRKDYHENQKWHTEAIFKTDEDFTKSYQELEQELSNYDKYKGNILSSAKNLYELLSFDTSFNKRLEAIFIYAHLKNDEDTTNPTYQSMFGAAHNIYQKYSEQTSYIIPELLKSNYSIIENYIKEYPKLKEYSRTLKEIYKYQKHTLSAKEELLLSSISNLFRTPDEVYSYLTDADLTFGKIRNEQGKLEELTEKTYRKFIESDNRTVRKSAFNKLLGTYKNFKNTYASLLMSEVTNNNKIAQIRNYDSAKEASLFSNDIPVAIYDNLITTVKKNLAPLSKFWQLKKESLGVSKLHLYDTNAPLTKETTHNYSIEEAKELLNKALSVLGETYITDLNKAFTEGWIDFCPNAGKRNGAYCTACYTVHPFVLLSFDGSLNNVSTLAHELGHAMHYYYAIKNQADQDYNYSIFVPEVASQVNQILLSKYLISHTPDIAEKKYLIDDLIRDFKATIYRQTMFAEFESIIHEQAQAGLSLTNEDLCNIYYKLNKEYFGKNIIIDDIIKYEWARIPHFYMNFYVYQYATAYAASIKIAMDILNNKENAVSNYLEFLKLGCTKTPIESLKITGIDMSKPDVLNDAFTYFDALVDELKNIL